MSQPSDTARAAAALGLAESTITKHCRSGVIRAVKVGHDWRISDAEIERYKTERRLPGRPAHRPAPLEQGEAKES